METRTFDPIRSPITAEDGWRAGLRRALRTRPYWIFSDQTLVLRARAGDDPAFDALVARYRDRLHTVALRFLGDEGKASDALDEMTLSASKDIGSSDAKFAPGEWLSLHGLRSVFKRMDAPPGRYAVESRLPAFLASRGRD